LFTNVLWHKIDFYIKIYLFLRKITVSQKHSNNILPLSVWVMTIFKDLFGGNEQFINVMMAIL